MATRVLIVEDSPLMQRLLTALIGAHDDLKVVGVAEDPYGARDMIKELKPDVLTLDVELPRMDGITFLEKLMRLRPMPVVMVSALTENNAEITLKALELGAVDFVTKPKGETPGATEAFGEALAESLREAARAELHIGRRPVAAAPVAEARPFKLGSLIAIGASTGGTEAIRELLGLMPPNVPPILVVQHMPEMFTRLFARRLDDLCGIKVTEVPDGEILQPGHAYIAPGDWHLRVSMNGPYYVAQVDQEVPINRHRPSVDALFHSVARVAGSKAAGILLTGMGRDGAEGLGAMQQAGGATFAQDQASCVVYGMPKAAVEAGYASHVGPVDSIAQKVIEALRR